MFLEKSKSCMVVLNFLHVCLSNDFFLFTMTDKKLFAVITYSAPNSNHCWWQIMAHVWVRFSQLKRIIRTLALHPSNGAGAHFSRRRRRIMSSPRAARRKNHTYRNENVSENISVCVKRAKTKRELVPRHLCFCLRAQSRQSRPLGPAQKRNFSPFCSDGAREKRRCATRVLQHHEA